MDLAEVDSNHRRGEVPFQILSGEEGTEVDIEEEGEALRNRCRRKDLANVHISCSYRGGADRATCHTNTPMIVWQ